MPTLRPSQKRRLPQLQRPPPTPTPLLPNPIPAKPTRKNPKAGAGSSSKKPHVVQFCHAAAEVAASQSSSCWRTSPPPAPSDHTRSRVGSGPSGTGEPRAIPIPALEPPPPAPPPEEWLFHSCSGYSGQLLCRPDAGLTAAPPNPPEFRQWPGQPKPWLA